VSLRSPRAAFLASRSGDGSPLQYEILQEKAASLGRAANRLTEALEALEAFDTQGDTGGDAASRRDELVARAGEAAWALTVQRELCGFRDPRWVLDTYRIPPEVARRMAPNSALTRR